MIIRLAAIAAAACLATACDASDPEPATDLAGAPTAAAVETTPTAVADTPSLPFYIDADGNGVLRYSPPNGEDQEYYIAIIGLTGNAERPREVIGGGVGPFAGPHLAVYYFDLTSITSSSLSLEAMRFNIYQQNPDRDVALFYPVIDAEHAEGMEGCGEVVNRMGTCSNTTPPED